ncbi:MAG: 23S rRNA (adenine(2503)-C(2))-methyltransferase RlmN [Clostridia bacterium]|nr:23S rRNA (adenine(2503)-C(2))-methyltransferase RlmN [Clostridia bacterium]
MINIYDLTLDDLKEYMKDAGEPKYRAEQLYRHIYEDVAIEDMTDISKTLRGKLSDDFYVFLPQIEKKLISKIDGTVKYLFKMRDGEYAESVVMKYKHGLSICVSSQVGCAMGCAFCASTLHGLKRNLTPGEISGQIIAAKKDLGQRISNIVMMGSGEPFQNTENVFAFLENAVNPHGLGIGARHITVSTCGILEGIRALSDLGYPINLSVSLHAPNDEIRKKLMPIAKSVSIDKLIDGCRAFFKKTGRRVTYEYALAEGVNDSEENAKELSDRLKNDGSHINLIPVNYVKERGIKRSNSVLKFKNVLEKNGINATVRREMGSDINAACGQLRNENLER